ncbi:outer membrane lipoprotein carrier protein LolA [Lutibacter sp. TH_r2]|uniref:LolA family protein n=1 Tax=Lutibacter sp. TH_r2 TaxID=3082083 RepID=UPI0029559ED9|nr:outer membrane lipoprotein carrier protein LolA [Lutibacter sp. TH_r2]MDV7188072.1 outer membrane lipoprotein carrier protein LolA [Lutibacter sp. TH_r2]
MKKIVLVITILCFGFIGFSQNSNSAKALLDEVAAKVESYNNIYIEFNHKLDNVDADVHQETKGNVTLQGDLYHLNYMGTEQIFDGKKVYLIIHEDEEVIIQNPSDNEEETLTPSKMFSFYKNGYNYEMGELKNVKGIKIQYVNLSPIDSNSEILSIQVGVDVKTKHIYNIIETGENGTITTLNVTSFKTNQTISSKIFSFDKAKYQDQKKYTISETN